ncbi:MAG: TrpB-like pyridoxal phosphate-dependent enzyme, partial [Puniceicoccaceae bacterium]
TAVGQPFYNREAGIKKSPHEPGVGQGGPPLVRAWEIFGLECLFYMEKVSFNQNPYRRPFMEPFGAKCFASPSKTTASGRAILEDDPDCTGSLGIAISEAVEVAAQNDDTNYCLGSVLNHVLLHQTVIGQEAIKQLEMAGDYPDVIVGCTGGGSNFAGIAFPFLGRKLRGEGDVRIVAVEPSACPSLTKGKHAYDFGDTAHLTPLVKMHTLGSTFVPPGFHSGGLRYHGMAPLVSHVVANGYSEARSYNQLECFAAGTQFARTEGIIPAPEATHAVVGAIREAERCREEGKSETILFNLCGHGHFDMQAYTDYNAGKLRDYDYPEEEIAMALAGLPSFGNE